MDGHVLEHALGIALEAFPEGLGGILVRVVGHERDLRALGGSGKLPGLADELADILVVPHEDGNPGSSSFGPHGFEFGDRGGTGLFEVNGGAAGPDGFAQQAGVVGRAARNESKALGGSRREFGSGLEELDTVVGRSRGDEFGKFGTSRSSGACKLKKGACKVRDRDVMRVRIARLAWVLLTGTQEPSLNNVAKFGRGAFISKELDGMIPSHSTERSAASNEDDFALIVSNSRGHLDFVLMDGLDVMSTWIFFMW
jgi:hypothetical protein